jgi:hypothetical protein
MANDQPGGGDEDEIEYLDDNDKLHDWGYANNNNGHNYDDKEAAAALADGDEIKDDEEGKPIDEYNEEGYAPL